MKKYIICIFLLLSGYAVAEIAIIGNIQKKQLQLTKLQVQDIFMGRTRTFPDNTFAVPFDQLNLRAEFYQKLTNRPIAQINAYWARLMFSGQTLPPSRLPDDQSIIKMVQENKDAIAYIDKENADKKMIHILLILQ